ncbi:TetR/AcrR family transcriptional regulator [Rugamonas sp.]|uniref:TetR/AcrR family transcriptional regulator n=1 Tax=Rugamonas sp. TaxID=1926287 RepID=UPI0025D09CE4|nr:TetR/AcrR family transcriptional regulator [Rugamonas sp.]
MRYPAAETAEKHQRILDEASRLFRERGFGGVSVSEIMKATGLTHGPFYNHFASKEALMAESLAHASDMSMAGMREAESSPQAMVDYVQGYLSDWHRDDPGHGCLMSALGSEASRVPAVRAGFTAHVRATIRSLAAYYPWSAKRNARRDAIRMMAAMVGAMVLARAVDDPELSEEILADVRSQFK